MTSNVKLFIVILLLICPEAFSRCKRVYRSLQSYMDGFAKEAKEMTIIKAKVTGHVLDNSKLGGEPFKDGKGRIYRSGNNIVEVKPIENLLGDGTDIKLYQLDSQYDNNIFNKFFPIGTQIIIFGKKDRSYGKTMLRMRGQCRRSIFKIKDNEIIGYITRSSDAKREENSVNVRTADFSEMFYASPRGKLYKKPDMLPPEKMTFKEFKDFLKNYKKKNSK